MNRRCGRVALLLAAVLCATGAAAQETAVSNIQRYGFTSTISRSIPIAQAFTTGRNTNGYALASVEVHFDDLDGTGFSASVYNVGSNGFPTSEFVSLNVPASRPEGRLTLYPATGVTLVANSHYAIWIHSSSDDAVDFRESHRGGRLDPSEDCIKATSGYNNGQCVRTADGWSIAPKHAKLENSSWSDVGTGSYGNGKGASMLMRIKTYVVLGPPTNLSATTSQDTVRLSWGLPADTEQSSSLRYRYRHKEESASSWGDWTEVSASPRTVSITGLTTGTSYDFQIQAVGQLGGPWSTSAETRATPVLELPAPANLTATPDTSDGTVDLTWVAVNMADRYEVRWKRNTHGFSGNAGGDEQLSWRDVGQVTEYTMKEGFRRELNTDGTVYDIEVRAVTVVEDGPDIGGEAASASAEPVFAGPEAPENLTAIGREAHVVLNWDPPADTRGITDYEFRVDGGEWRSTGECIQWIYYNNNPNDLQCRWTARVTPDDETSYVVHDLRDGVNYEFEVRAVVDSNGGRTATVSATPVYGMLTEVKQPVKHCFLIGVLGSDPPRLASGWQFECYWLAGSMKYRRSGEIGRGYDVAITTGANRKPNEIVAMMRHSRHRRGWTIARTTMKTAPALAVQTPGHIPVLNAVAAGSSQIDLLWATTWPESASYEIEWSADGETGWRAVNPADDGGDTMYSHTGLEASTAYHYRVRGVNDHGEGPWAAAAETTAVQGTEPQTPTPVPEAPTSLTVEGVSTSSIELAWAAPSGIVSGYEVEWSAEEDGGWTAVETAHSGTETRYSHTGLDSGTTHYYRVRAANETGPGDWSNVASGSTASQPVEQSELTAQFEDVPASHDGSSTFSFRVRFSEDVQIGFEELRDHAFVVTGGVIRRARRVDGRHDLREIQIEPNTRNDITIELAATNECGTAGALCTSDGRRLANSQEATVAGPPDDPASVNTPATGAPTIGGTVQVEETLTASVSGIADADGLDDASFEYQWIRGNTDIQGATDSSYTLVSADEGETIKVRVSFTDDNGSAESLTSASTDPVAAAPEPLTAEFDNVPDAHDGESPFTFGLTFSEEPAVGYRTLRDSAFDVSGGAVRKARRREQGSNRSWEITVEPDSHTDVSIRLPETGSCSASGAICTGDGRPLSHALSASVRGPAAMSVSDARVEEAAGAAVAFAVTLSRAASDQVTVGLREPATAARRPARTTGRRRAR